MAISHIKVYIRLIEMERSWKEMGIKNRSFEQCQDWLIRHWFCPTPCRVLFNYLFLKLAITFLITHTFKYVHKISYQSQMWLEPHHLATRSYAIITSNRILFSLLAWNLMSKSALNETDDQTCREKYLHLHMMINVPRLIFIDCVNKNRGNIKHHTA